MTKSAFVAIVGRPSSGKSTFLNTVCGQKISIVSRVPQTTRNKIRGIYHCSHGQLVFVDTPGFQLSEKKFNTYLKDLVLTSLNEVDLVLYLVDASRRPGLEERALLTLVSEGAYNCTVVLNKIDLLNNYSTNHQQEIRSAFPHNPPIRCVSALRGDGIPDVLTTLLERAPEGEMLYPSEFYTDQTPEFRISEIIREKAIHETTQEVPHALYVEIADLEIQANKLWVRGFLCVERKSQKGILIGSQGQKIRRIRCEAERELSAIFPYETVALDLRVKVRPKWRRSDRLLREVIG